MSSVPLRHVIPHSRVEQLREARRILQMEADAVLGQMDRLGETFCVACETIQRCSGNVVVTGIGKAGLIARKIAATMSSTGTRARFLHPAEAVHGDLGCVASSDIILALSNSGETEEVIRLIPILQRLQVAMIAVTAREESTLGQAADLVIPIGELPEAGPHGLAPTTSTTAMLAVGDALALVVSHLKGFTPQQFAVFHPAGNLGLQLKSVKEVMRRGEELRIARDTESVRDVFITSGKPGRRTGAVMLVDEGGCLSGLFTDSDLARLLERRRDGDMDRPIFEVMTRHPKTVTAALLVRDVIGLMSDSKLSEFPVVDDSGRPIGLIDITDVISCVPAEKSNSA